MADAASEPRHAAISEQTDYERSNLNLSIRQTFASAMNQTPVSQKATLGQSFQSHTLHSRLQARPPMTNYGPKAVERRNTADYSSSSGNSDSDSDGDRKQQKPALTRVPQRSYRSARTTTRVPLPSRLAPLTPHSRAIHEGHGQIVTDYPPSSLLLQQQQQQQQYLQLQQHLQQQQHPQQQQQQQRQPSPISLTYPSLSHLPTLVPIQSGSYLVQSRRLPSLNLTGHHQMRMASLQSTEVVNESVSASDAQQTSSSASGHRIMTGVLEQRESLNVDGNGRNQFGANTLGQLLGVGPRLSDPAVMAALSLDSDDPLRFASSEPIHEVALKGNIPELKRQIAELGPDVADHGLRTPLMYAVLGNQKKACQVLLKAGARVNNVDSYGMTALLWASHLDRPDTVSTLLSRGADMNVCDPNGRTVFHWCSASSGTKCLRLLISKAAKAIVDKQDKNRLTALHWAVMCQHPSHIRILISEGHSKVDIQDSDGRTPLNYAVLNYASNCIKAIMECEEAAVAMKDNKGRTAMHYACGEGNMECIRALASCPSCDINCSDNRSTTPLHWAAAGNQPEVIRFLLRRKADKGMTDGNGMTALEHAQTRKHSSCIEVLEKYNPMESPSLTSLYQPHRPTRQQSTTSLGATLRTKFIVPLRSRFSVSSLQVVAAGSDSSSTAELGVREEGDGSQGDHAKETVEPTQNLNTEDKVKDENSQSGHQTSVSMEVRKAKQRTRRRRLMPWLCSSGCVTAVHPFPPQHPNTHRVTPPPDTTPPTTDSQTLNNH